MTPMLFRALRTCLMLLLTMLFMPPLVTTVGAATVQRTTEHAVMPHPYTNTSSVDLVTMTLHRTDFAGTGVGYLTLMRPSTSAGIVKRSRPSGLNAQPTLRAYRVQART